MKSAFRSVTATMLAVIMALMMVALAAAAPAAAMTEECPDSGTGAVLQDKEEEEEVPTLSRTSLTMKAGQEVKVSVSHGVVKTWQSSNTKIVKVKNGLLTALKKGGAVITATLTTGKKLKCNVTVSTSPELSKSSVSVKRGKTTKVKISGKADSVNNLYKNTSIAKVTSKKTASTLKVKGLKKGSTTLKIRVNGVWLKVKVKVEVV